MCRFSPSMSCSTWFWFVGIAETDAKPFGLGLTDLLVVADYTEFAGQLIYLWKDFTALAAIEMGHVTG